jgi:FkbM family methyltransferase
MLRYLIAEVYNDIVNVVHRDMTLEVVLTKWLLNRVTKRLGLHKLFIGRRAIKLPDGVKIYINDEATIYINIPDHYIRKEYLRHSDYIPCKGWIVFDIGTYVGIYTLYAAKKVCLDGFVTSFEPNPLAFRWLLNNIALNNVGNVKALPFALGDRNSKMLLYVAGENIEASSFIANHITHNPSGQYTIVNTFTVLMTKLDYVIEKSNQVIGKVVTHIDLVKIDVEGYEMHVLRGAEKTLSKGLIERFVIEVHKDQVSTKNLVEYLKSFGYTTDKIITFCHIKDVVYLKLKR